MHADNVALAQSGLGLLCRREAFCSICRLGVCLSCCPDHKTRHHGVGPGAIVKVSWIPFHHFHGRMVYVWKQIRSNPSFADMYDEGRSSTRGSRCQSGQHGV